MVLIIAMRYNDEHLAQGSFYRLFASLFASLMKPVIRIRMLEG